MTAMKWNFECRGAWRVYLQPNPLSEDMRFGVADLFYAGAEQRCGCSQADTSRDAWPVHDHYHPHPEERRPCAASPRMGHTIMVRDARKSTLLTMRLWCEAPMPSINVELEATLLLQFVDEHHGFVDRAC